MNIVAIIQGIIMVIPSFIVGIFTLGLGLTLMIGHWIGLLLGGVLAAFIGFMYGYQESIKNQEKEEIRKYQVKQARSQN